MLEDKYMEVLIEMNLDLTEAWQSATDWKKNLYMEIFDKIMHLVNKIHS